MKCLYIFIRDLRIHDNITLNKVLEKYNKKDIQFLFFLNKEQINSNYASKISVSFFTKALDNLKEHVNLKIVNVKNLNDILLKIKEFYFKHKYESIAFHYDYTQYAIKREFLIKTFASKNGVNLINTHDQLLLSDFHLKSDNTNYFKFTPYYNTYPKSKINNVKYNIPISNDFDIKNYNTNRNIMSIKTTQLSVYLKYGVISTREAYSYFKGNPELAKQLIWRDFYYTYYFFNQDYSGDNNIKIKWQYNQELFNKWKTGNTGIPIVDAGMRQLNTTGHMHNRARMIVASTLAKLMLINWKLGEKYFSNKLIDIDRIQNMAGWHSVVGIAKHSLPYFRVFNPWIQAKNFDPECKYIKTYIPELKNVDNNIILNWDTNNTVKINYPQPCINYNKQKDFFLKSISKN